MQSVIVYVPVWCLIIGRDRGKRCPCVWLTLVFYTAMNCQELWLVWREFADSSRMTLTSSVDLIRRVLCTRHCFCDVLKYNLVIFTPPFTQSDVMYLHLFPLNRVFQKKNGQSFTCNKFQTICRKMKIFTPKCLAEITVYLSMQTMCKLVKYSLLNSQK